MRRAVHFIASAWHILSASAFLIFVASKRDDARVPSSFKFRVPVSTEPGFVASWTALCYDTKTRTTFNVSDLDTNFDADERCLLTLKPNPVPSIAFELPILFIPAFCAYWSAFVHLCCGLFHIEDGYLIRRVRFCVDYGVTAPLMLSATVALWAARNVVAVVVYPLYLFLLLESAPWLEDLVVFRLDAECFVLVGIVLSVFVGTTIVPPIDGAYHSLPDEAPASVWVAVIFFVSTFSIFLVPYLLSILDRLRNSSKTDAESDRAFVWYTACSMIAKTTLHANVALVAAVQLLVEAQPLDTKPRITMEDAGVVAGLASGLAALGGLVMLVSYFKFLK